MMLNRSILLSLVAVACGLNWGTATVMADSHECGVKGLPPLDIGGLDQAGGTIKGVVKFEGQMKTPKPERRVKADPVCAHAHADEPLLKETYVWGKDSTLQNVFVYVSKGVDSKKFDLSSKKAILDQRGCAYVPHVSGVVTGQELEIRNSDKTTHNIKLDSKKNGKENNTMPSGSKPLTKVFKKAEAPITYKCDVHPWMAAYVHVMDHPFFAVTQANGTFEIRGLPAGDYEVSVWHELKAFQADNETLKVSVTEGEAAKIAFTFAPKKKKKS